MTTEEVRLTLPIPFAEFTVETEDTTINTATKTMDVILSLIKQNPKITAKELAVLCRMTKDGVYYHIKKLKGKGYIVRDEGKRHGGQWIVIDGHSDTKKLGGI